METRVYTEENDIPVAAASLRLGGLVAVPTETVYGLCANGLDAEAVAHLYEVKGRPEVKPLSLMVAGPAEIEKYAEHIPPAAFILAARFWPGPLTLVLEAKKDVVPSIVRAGKDTVGLRCPAHPLTLSLLERARLPLAGPSANPSGAPSPTTAQQVLAYFDGQIEGVIDGGECTLSRESTILDLTQKPFKILREGALAKEEIENALLSGVRLIGVTGGSGSGKTTVTQFLAAQGVLALDCDKIYHELLETNADMLAEIEARFPAVFKNGKRVCADRQSSVDELLASLPDAEPVVAVGDGAELFVRLCSEHGRENIKAAPSFLRYIKASAVAELALRGDCEKRDCVSLAPVYLRSPQAERERLERENAAKQN